MPNLKSCPFCGDKSYSEKLVEEKKVLGTQGTLELEKLKEGAK
jgi:hypothetical protein